MQHLSGLHVHRYDFSLYGCLLLFLIAELILSLFLVGGRAGLHRACLAGFYLLVGIRDPLLLLLHYQYTLQP